MKKELKFIQFIHSWKECKTKKVGIWEEWKSIWHTKKFLKCSGDYINKDNKLFKKQDLYFWGEWESISKKIVKLQNYNDWLPTKVYEPDFHNINDSKLNLSEIYNKDNSFLNTDPYVFWEKFIYNNCLQLWSDKLRNLDKWSIIVFWSLKWNKFILDTVFVVGNSIKLKHDSLPCSEIHDLVTRSLLKEEINYNKLVEYYWISYYENNDFYSFSPCSIDGSWFKRPNIILDWFINQKKSQWIKVTPLSDIKDSIKIWNSITDQIKNDNLNLWVKFYEH